MADSEGLGPTERAELGRKLNKWKSEGFDVEKLSPLLDSGAEEAHRAFETAEKGIERLRGLSAELRELENADNAAQVEKIKAMLRDPWQAQEAENAIVELQVFNEKRKKEALRRQRDEERRIREVTAMLESYKSDGFVVYYLEEAIRKGADTAERELARFQDYMARLRDCDEELGSLDTSGFPDERRRIVVMLKDPAKIHDIEEALLQLRVKIERAKREGALKQEQGKREKEKLIDRMSELRSEGFTFAVDAGAFEGEGAAKLTQRLQELERSVARVKELRDELEQIKDPDLALEKDEAVAQLKDLANVHGAEEKIVRLQLKAERLKKEKARRSEESEKRHSEARTKIAEWRSKGYDTSKLETTLEKDDEALKRDLVMFRIQLRRIQELEAELRTLPPAGIEDELAGLLARTKSVSIGVITELEDGLQSLRSTLEAKKEAEVSKKEVEKKEKQELVEKLSRWVMDGYRDGLVERVDRVMSQPLTEIRDEFTKLEGDILRMNKLKSELESLDTTGFEAEVALILAKIRDISKGAEVELRITELRGKVERKREEELRKTQEERVRRDEFHSKVAEWRDAGYNVALLERQLDGDMDVLRREMAIVRMRIQKAQELHSELAAIETRDSAGEADAIRKDLRDLDRIPENEERIERLRGQIAAQEIQNKKRSEFRDKLADYQSQGYEIGRLERALNRDLGFVAKEFLVFKIKIQKLKELEDEIRTLDRTGVEKEALELEGDLKNPDKISEIREKLSALQSRMESRRVETLKKHEDEKKLKENYMNKMAAWLEEGFFVDNLEEALGDDINEMTESFKIFGEGVETSRRLRKELDEISQPGFEELTSRIKEKLRDLTKLHEVWADLKELKERVEKKKQEEEERRREEDVLRKGMLQQVDAWKKLGYDVSLIERASNGTVEDLRRAIVNFKIRMERMRATAEILAGLQAPGFDVELERLRAMARDPSKTDEVAKGIAALKESIRAKKKEELQKREELRKLHDSCTDKFLEWISDGYNVDRLEKAIFLPPEEMAAEFRQISALVERLKVVEEGMRQKGIDTTSERDRLHDIGSVAFLEDKYGIKPPPPASQGSMVRTGTKDKEPDSKYGHGVEKGATEPTRTEPEPRSDGIVWRTPETPGGRPTNTQAEASPTKQNDNIIMENDKGTEKQDQPRQDIKGPTDRGAPPPQGEGASSALTMPDKLTMLRQKVAEWKKAGLDVAALERCLSSNRPDPEELRVRLEEFKDSMKRLRKPAENDGGDEMENGEASKAAKKLKKVMKVSK